MSEINVILAPLSGRTVCTTKTVYQYNQGMILRLLGIDLPQAYTVDFANSVTGNSISQVGNADGVTIPDQFFVPGSTIHAWVVIIGTGYSVTRYHIMIPISPRAVRTNEEPTPSQQSALDEAIAALNQAVENCEDAAEAAVTAASHYPRINAGYWEVWNPATGAYESTGVEAQGSQGETGPAGADGQDGVSPTVTVADITGGHSVTITDADHPSGQSFDVLDGTNGTDGVTFTPSVSNAGVISWTNDGGKQNPQSVDIPALVLVALPYWTGGSY